MSAGLIIFESDAFNPRLHDTVRMIVSVGIVLVLWIAETLLSVASVALLVKHGNAAISNSNSSMQKNAIRGLIYFSIVPCVQFVPFIYANIVDSATIMQKQAALKSCMGQNYSLYDFDYYERAETLLDCGFDYYDESPSVMSNILTEVLNVCECIVVWKPFFEALSILLLLPGFRRILIAKLYRLSGCIRKHSTSTTAPTKITTSVGPAKRVTFA
ncbi:hypothetical protein AAVH_19019 [Aphelenchoides avenae]|nr:hypothetical protein AAVH_19019 [Aphelenchus avenae]